MIGTLFSLLIAVYLFFIPLPEEISDPLAISSALIIISILFILVQTLLTGFAWGPLQRNEKNLLPRSMEMYRQDAHLRYSNGLILAFLLFTYLVIIELIFFDHIQKIYLLAIWTITLGFAIDLLHHFLIRIHQFLDPYYVVDLFVEKANKSIQNDRERELCHWIEALSETGIKAIDKNSPSLTNHVLTQLEQVMKNFLTSSKSFIHSELDEESKEMGIQDRVSYTLFYFFEHLEYIHNRALEKNLETTSSRTIGILGKVVYNAANYDITYARYPIHYIGQFAKKAQSKHFTEIGNKAILTLLQVSKRIITDLDVRYMNLQDPMLSIITYMSEIAKENFRQDKKTDIGLLKQPFYDLKEILDKIKDHQDYPVIQQSIDNVLNEFAALEAVLSSLPPLPIDEEIEEEEEKEEEGSAETP